METEAEYKTPPKRTQKRESKKAMQLGLFKIYSDASDPLWATNGSACFDLKAYLKPSTEVNIYDSNNEKTTRNARDEIARDESGIWLNPGDRALIPTGLVFDIPEYHSIRIHPRSGLSWKSGLNLSNCEGVVDYDYVEQMFISIHNTSRARVWIADGERIAQAELVEVIHSNAIDVVSLSKKPAKKTTRSGGFGSSGKK